MYIVSDKIMHGKLYDKSMQLPEYVYIEPKYDGIRAIIIKNKNSIKAYSRSDKELINLEKLLDTSCMQLPDGVYDAEVFTKSWNDTMTILYNSKVASTEVNIYVFEYFTLSEWQTKKCNLTYEQRRHRLEEIFKKIKCIYFKLVPAKKIKSTDIDKYFDIYKYKYEGLMIKKPNSLYAFGKRTDDWIKLKEVDYQTYKIVDILPGTGKNKDRLGAFVVEKNGKRFKVGGGFTDAEREEFWKKKDELIGKCIEITFFKSKQKNAKVIFPVFHRLRLDTNEC